MIWRCTPRTLIGVFLVDTLHQQYTCPGMRVSIVAIGKGTVQIFAARANGSF